MTPLDLGRNVVLERFEFTIATTHLPYVHGWICRSLRTITSPLFNEFVIWLLGSGFPRSPMNGDGWGTVDASLIALAERNPDFRVVFRGDGDRWFIASYLPLVWAKGLIQFHFPRGENRFQKLGIV